jgi:hypothetical protein
MFFTWDHGLDRCNAEICNVFYNPSKKSRCPWWTVWKKKCWKRNPRGLKKHGPRGSCGTKTGQRWTVGSLFNSLLFFSKERKAYWQHSSVANFLVASFLFIFKSEFSPNFSSLGIIFRKLGSFPFILAFFSNLLILHHSVQVTGGRNVSFKKMYWTFREVKKVFRLLIWDYSTPATKNRDRWVIIAHVCWLKMPLVFGNGNLEDWKIWNEFTFIIYSMYIKP